MLQQTQALRVVPYYERWLARFPDAPALAARSDARRARARGAGSATTAARWRCSRRRRVVAERGWPADLTELPGVGPYTAAAVGSFAWDAQVAAVDTNVRRVLIAPRRRRLHAARSSRARAGELLPRGRAAAFNQAMMELGATVCRPRAPRCGECPVAPGCGGPREQPRRRAGGRASRTPIAGRAAACSRRCSPARSRPSTASAASARWPGWSATDSSSATRMDGSGCPESASTRARVLS